MKIRLIRPAKMDMARIWAYYEKQRSGLGDEFLDELGKTVRNIRDFPLAPPEFWRGSRRALLRRFPYGIAYIIVEDEARVIAIAHLARATKVWTKRLKQS